MSRAVLLGGGITLVFFPLTVLQCVMLVLYYQKKQDVCFKEKALVLKLGMGAGVGQYCTLFLLLT